jgi:hypothetical protein
LLQVEAVAEKAEVVRVAFLLLLLRLLLQQHIQSQLAAAVALGVMVEHRQ